MQFQKAPFLGRATLREQHRDQLPKQSRHTVALNVCLVYTHMYTFMHSRVWWCTWSVSFVCLSVCAYLSHYHHYDFDQLFPNEHFTLVHPS